MGLSTMRIINEAGAAYSLEKVNPHLFINMWAKLVLLPQTITQVHVAPQALA